MLEWLLALKLPGGSVPFTPPAVVAGKPYKGFVASVDLITGDDLAAAIGLTAGISHNNDGGWLHYIDGAREFYIARTTFRYGLGFTPIETALVGPKTVQIGENYYQVKQITGMSVDPFTTIIGNAGGGDWDAYIYPLITGPARAQITADVWSYFTETDLGLSANWGTQPNGSITHVLERHNALPARASRGRNYSGGTAVASVVGRTVYNEGNPGEGNAGTGINQYGWRPMLEKVAAPADPDVFYGEVASADFITAAALTTAVGMGSVGTVTNADSPWLKFKIKGKTLYTTKLPLRHAVTWNAMNALGIVFGATTIVIGGATYKVRLMTGAKGTPTAWDSTASGGEFNDIFYPITGGASSAQAVVQAYPRWASYSDAALGFGSDKNAAAGGTGTLTFCQEATTNGGYLARGYNDGDNAGVAQLLAGWYVAGATVQTYAGWRPVLELVP